MFEVWLMIIPLIGNPGMKAVGDPILGYGQCMQAAQMVQQQAVLKGKTNETRFMGIVCVPVVEPIEIDPEVAKKTG